MGLFRAVARDSRSQKLEFEIGRYNPRQLNKASVGTMVRQFQEGHCSSRLHPLRFAVDKRDVLNGDDLLKTYDTGSSSVHENVPEIEWAPHVFNRKVVVLAGQHRLASIKAAWGPMIGEYQELETRQDIMKVERDEKDNRGEDSTELEEQLRMINLELERSRSYLDLLQRWPVELYDDGKCLLLDDIIERLMK